MGAAFGKAGAEENGGKTGEPPLDPGRPPWGRVSGVWVAGPRDPGAGRKWRGGAQRGAAPELI